MRAWTLAIALVMAGSASAEPTRTDVSSGRIHADSGRYDEAIDKLEPAMAAYRAGTLELRHSEPGKAYAALIQAYYSKTEEMTDAAALRTPVEAISHCLALPEEALGRSKNRCELYRDQATAQLLNLYSQRAQQPGAELSDLHSMARALDAQSHMPLLGDALLALARSDYETLERSMRVVLTGMQGGRPTPLVQYWAELIIGSIHSMAFAQGRMAEARVLAANWSVVLASRDVPDALEALDTLSQEIARVQAALAGLKAEAEAHPADLDRQNNYAGNLLNFGAYAASLAWWKQATSTRPDVAELWLGLGVGQFNEAARLQEANATQLDMAAHLTQAAIAFRRCLEVQPDHGQCKAHLARVEGMLGGAE